MEIRFLKHEMHGSTSAYYVEPTYCPQQVRRVRVFDLIQWHHGRFPVRGYLDPFVRIISQQLD
jgi:hypothetical protein